MSGYPGGGYPGAGPSNPPRQHPAETAQLQKSAVEGGLDTPDGTYPETRNKIWFGKTGRGWALIYATIPLFSLLQ